MTFAGLMACFGLAVELAYKLRDELDGDEKEMLKSLKAYRKMMREARIKGDYSDIEESIKAFKLPPP
jgi:hypothetical protein